MQNQKIIPISKNYGEFIETSEVGSKDHPWKVFSIYLEIHWPQRKLVDRDEEIAETMNNLKTYKDKKVLITGHTGFKASQKAHMIENLDIFDFELSNSDIQTIAKLDLNITQFPEWE